MKKIMHTILSGYAGLLLPLIVLVILLEKLAHIIKPIVHAIEDKLNITSIFGITTITVINILLMLLIGFLAGLLMRSKFVKKWIGKFENNILRRIPLYNVIKTIADQQAGTGDAAGWRPALVKEDDAHILGKIVAESENYYTIMYGAASMVGGGECKIVDKDRVIIIDMPLLEFMQYEKLHGGNSAQLAEKYLKQNS